MATLSKATTCCACGREIPAGATFGLRNDLGRARTVHSGSCETKDLPATYLRRFNQLFPLQPAEVRALAMKMGQKVSRDKRYLPHAEVCYNAAMNLQGVAEDKWQGAVALATGKKPAAAAVPAAAGPAAAAAPATAPLPANLDEAVAEAVAAALAEALGDVDQRVDAAAREIAVQAAADAVKALAPRVVAVSVNGGAAVKVGRTHFQFERLLKMVAAGVNVWLCGPAGSGKTTAAEQVATALGLPFKFNGAIDSEYKLSGFVDAQGRIVSTAFRDAWTNGGVYLFDEVDASMPSAVLAFNAALSGSLADFPGVDKPVPKHPDFHCIAAANTWGHGATMEYVGRSKMDAAFVDRFCQLSWEYDEALERELAPNKPWCEKVQRLRRAAKARGMKVVISPRATINGGRLLVAGMTEAEALDATIRAKMSAQDWDNLKAAA